MVTIALKDAQIRLSELLDRVAEGENVVITRDGRPAARLSPPLVNVDGEPTTPERVQQAFDNIEQMRQTLVREGRALTTQEILQFIREGRR